MINGITILKRISRFRIISISFSSLFLFLFFSSFLIEMRDQTPTGISKIQCRSANNIDRSSSKYTNQSIRYQRRIYSLVSGDRRLWHGDVLVPPLGLGFGCSVYQCFRTLPLSASKFETVR